MLTALQQAIQSCLETTLAADATLSGIPYEVRTVTEEMESPNPGDRHLVVARVQDTPSPLRKLRNATVGIMIVTPIEQPECTAANQKVLELAVENAWDIDETPEAPQRLADAIETNLSGWTGGGYHARGWQAGTQENSYLPTFEVYFGAQKV